MASSAPKERPTTTVVRLAADVADVLATLDAPGALPVRTLVVPGGRYLHEVRKALLLGGRHHVLVGLDGVTPVELARTLLDRARVERREREEEVRATRVARRLAAGEVPAGFDENAILRARGWDVAFAETINELEAAGLRPADLPADGVARAHGLAQMWESLDDEAGQRWSSARVVAEAVGLAAAWRPDGPVVAVVSADTQVVELELLAAVPGLHLVVQAMRPIDDVVVARFERILGADAAEAVTRSCELSGSSALARWQREPTGQASAGELDDSLTLEQHEGVDREVDAATRWVLDQVRDRLPLEEIAVLSAERDPYEELLADRIRNADDLDPLPVHVAGGLPFATVGGGGPVLRVLRALAEHLSADALWDLLPSLRLAQAAGREHARRYLTRAEAFSVAFGLGTAGGHPVVPARAREWPQRALRLIEQLETEAQQPEPEGKAALRHRDRQAQREHLARILPALDALDRVVTAVLDDGPLDRIISGLRDLARDHFGQGAKLAAAQLFTEVEDQDVPAHVAGTVALEHLIVTAEHLRVPTCRFGEPAVFVGSLAHAAGMGFRAVRIVGLAEGTVPPRVRPDVVLGQHLRGRLGLPGRGERLTAVRRRFDAARLSAKERLVLSCPRVVLDRAVRAPSPVFGEAITATTGASDPLAVLEEAFRAARERAEGARRDRPLRVADRLDRAAVTHSAPADWRSEPRLEPPSSPAGATPSPPAAPVEGAAGRPLRWEHPPGLAAEHPISGSRLGTLLECPYRFFLTQALHWAEPAAPPEPSSLPPLAYGNAIHHCVELLFTRHGADFERRVGDLDAYLAHTAQIVDQIWEELRDTLVLENDEAWETERTRAHDHMRALVEHEWEREPGQWIAAERPFGVAPEPAVRVDTPTGPVWVAGFIDRLRLSGHDRGEQHIEVWDVKSGKNSGRVAIPSEPGLAIDLQIGVYTVVARALRDTWELPSATAAGYVFADHAKGPERYFGPERAGELADATLHWLSVARGLLDAGLYPRTPNQDDCTYCPFKRSCGPGATLRSARALRRAKEPLRAFAVLKGIDVDDEEGAA